MKTSTKYDREIDELNFYKKKNIKDDSDISNEVRIIIFKKGNLNHE